MHLGLSATTIPDRRAEQLHIPRDRTFGGQLHYELVRPINDLYEKPVKWVEAKRSRVARRMDTGKMRPGYTERARAIQALKGYPMAGWIAELNRAHAREPKTWTLSVVAEILDSLRDLERTQTVSLPRR